MAKRKRQSRSNRGPREFMTPVEARLFMDKWAAEQNAIIRAKRNVRNLIDDFREYVEDAGLDLDRVDAGRMMEQYRRHAKYGLSKKRSALTRSRVEFDREAVLSRFKHLRPKFKSDSACAAHIARSGETFRHRSGAKRTISRNTILDYLKARHHRPAM